jgi:hypothetical protein
MRVRSISVALVCLAMVACGSDGGDVFSLEVGDCFDEPEDAEQVSQVPVVDCAEPHGNEVFAVFDLPDGDYPGTEAVQTAASDGCLGDRFESYVGTAYPESEIFASALWPTEGSWGAGDREVVCFLFEPGVQLIGSQRGAGR